MTMPPSMAGILRRLLRSFIPVTPVAIALATLAGCASFDPEGGAAPNPAAAPDIPKVASFDNPESAEHKRLTAQFGGEYHYEAAEGYLNQVLARLAASDERPSRAYRVTILNSPVVNAFALPSGNLYITRGLLALANDTSEVAAVMAHEIGHVTANHASQRAEKERTEALKTNVASAIQSRSRGEEVMVDGRLSLASFSRSQELEADQIGVRTIARAGYDPYGASRFLASLGKSTALRSAMLGGRSRDDSPDITSTHPSTPERISRAIAVARQIGASGIGEAGREPYLRAIDGIDFGDDPAEGVVRGRRFMHPKLGFGFTAPEGFSLENSSKALLGVAGGGAEAMRLDSVALSASTTLESYLMTGWIEGLQQSSIQARTINGLPAAVATAKSGDWSFRVGVVRFGSDVYRIIFATRILTDAADRRYIDALDTFRRLSSDESRRVRPYRLSVVTAGVGDSIDSLASRMALQDHAADYFVVLNGLDRAAPLSPGRQYKLVVE